MPAKSSHGWRRAASIAARVAQQRDPPAAAQAGAFSSIQHTQQSTNLQAWKEDWASIFPKSGGPGYRRAEEAVEQQQASALQPRAREEQLQNSSTVGPAARVRAVSGRTGKADFLLSRIQGQQKNTFPLPAPPPLWPPQLTQSGIAESPQQLQQNVSNSNSKDHAITDTTPGAAGTSEVLGLDSITTNVANLAAAEASKISETAARISEEASKSSAADNAGSPIADEAGGVDVFGTEHVLHGIVPVPGMSADPPSQPVLSLSSKSIGAPPAAADDPEIRPAAAAAEDLAIRLIAATAKDLVKTAAAAVHASTCVPTDSTSSEFAPLPMPAAHADAVTSSSFPSETVITPALTFASIELVHSDLLELPAPVSTPAEPHPMPPPESTFTSSSPAVDSLRPDDSTLSNSTPPAWGESALPAVRLTLSSVDLEPPSPQNAITAAQPMLEVTHLSEKTATAYSVSQVIRKSLAASYTAARHATPAATLATTPVATPATTVPATSSPTPVATLPATTAAAAAAASPATQAAAAATSSLTPAAAAAATSSPTPAAAAATQAAAAADRSITAFTASKVIKENAEPGSARGLRSPTTDPGVLHVMHSQTLTQEVAAESTTHATPSHASASHTHEAALTEADAQLTTGNTTVHTPVMVSLHGKQLRARAAVPLSRPPKQLSMPPGLTAPPSSKLAAIGWSPLLRQAAPTAGSALRPGPAIPQAPVGAALKTSDLAGGQTASAAVPAAPSPAAPSPAASAATGMAASSAFSAPHTMDPATPVLSSYSIHHPKTAAPALAAVTAAAQPPPRLQLHSCDMMQQHDTLLQALQALRAPQAQAGGTIDRPSPAQQTASAIPAFSANALTSAAAALSPNAAQRSSPAVGLAALLSHRQAVPVGRLLPQDVVHPTPAELTHTPATIPQAAEPGCRVTQCTADAARSFLERFSLSYTQKQEGQRTPNQPTPAALAAEQAPLITASSSSMQTLLTQQPPAATTIPGVATGVAAATAVVTTAAGPCARMLLGRLKDLAKSLVQPASWPEVEERRERDTRVAGLREAKPLVLRQEESVDLMQSLDREAKRARGCKDAPVSAISSRWASKMQTLQQQKEPAARGALAAAASKAVLGKEVLEAKAEEQTAVTIPAGVSVEQLASLLGVQIAPLEAFLLSLGDSIMSEHDSVCADSAELAALEFGKLAICLKPEPAVQHPRNPVVTIMGHVDHGKTSLLDALRKTSVAASEAGGITQHVGAFEVQLPASQSSITFLDTPGHAAFTAMRARGAAVTDIVVLVVAADDGIMPQTRESIAHAHAADCPIVVAITKCDLPQAKVDHVKQQLAAAGLELEEYGGHVQVVQTCAVTGQGLVELEEAILLQAELMELKAASSVPAEAVVVEASLDKRLGALATVIVKQGEMQVGDCIVVGTEYGKVRAMKDCKGGKLQRAAPGQPCQIIGIKGLPLAGDQLMVVASEERGRKISEARAERADDFRRSQLAQRQVTAQQKARAMLRAATAAKKKLKSTMQGMWAGRKQLSAEERRLLEDGSLDTQTKLQRLGLQDEGVGEEEAAAELGRLCEPVSLLVKVDVQGSLEAVRTALQQLDTPQAPLKLVYSGVGLLTESDVDLATSTGASILTFNLPTIRGNVEAAIKQRGVKLMNHRVIYHLLDDVQRLLEGASAIQEEEVVVGTAEVLATFPLTKAGRKEVGRIAGCRVKDGSIDVKAFCFRLVREGTTVWEGSATSIKRDRQEVDNVGRNTECGVVLEGGRFSEFRVGDTLLCVKKQVARPAAGSK